MLLHNAGQATVAFEIIFSFPVSQIHELISGYLIWDSGNELSEQ